MASQIDARNPDSMRPPGGHYSHGVIANGFVFVSGQLPITPEGVKLVDAAFDAQVAQVLANVDAVLNACGTSIARLVQVRVYVDDIDNWPAFNTAYAKWAGDAKPARCIVPSGALHFGLKLEIEAIALAGTAGKDPS